MAIVRFVWTRTDARAPARSVAEGDESFLRIGRHGRIGRIRDV
jgi:hypothetical protein